MCVVSMIMEHFEDDFRRRCVPPAPWQWNITEPWVPNPLTQEEVDQLRRLLERAKEYDKKNNEPDCELEEKKQSLKTLAKQLGVEIDFL